MPGVCAPACARLERHNTPDIASEQIQDMGERAVIAVGHGGTWWDGEHKGAITGPFAEELREKRAAFESALEKLEELEDRCPNVPVFFLNIVP